MGMNLNLSAASEKEEMAEVLQLSSFLGSFVKSTPREEEYILHHEGFYVTGALGENARENNRSLGVHTLD